VKVTEGHSSGLSIRGKASSVKTSFGPPVGCKAGSKKAPTTPVGKDESSYASTHVINMVDSSASEGDVSPLERRQKRARKSPSRDVSLEPSRVADVPMIEGLASSLFA
jgi:hypothetical protein